MESSNNWVIEIRGTDRALTVAARSFLSEIFQLASLNNWFIHVELFASEHSQDWKAHFERLYPEHVGGDAFDFTAGAVAGQGALHPAIYEMLFTRTVDTFLTYLADIISLAYRTKKDLLKSKDTVEMIFVLEHNSMDEFIDAMIAKKVNELAYMNVRDLDTFCKNRGIELFGTPEELENFSYLNECRNALVHNRGSISQVFKNRFPTSQEKVGDQITVSYHALIEASKNMLKVGLAADTRISQKFGIPIGDNNTPDQAIR